MWKIQTITTLLLASTALAQQPAIVDVDWLVKQDRSKLILLHIGNADEYAEGHITGAQFINPDSFIYTSGMTTTDRVYDLPELSVLKELLESNGIKKDSRIVLYPGKTSHLPVTRLLFTLHYLGFKDQVSILSGGKDEWVAKGQKLTSQETKITRSTLALKPNENLLVSKKQVQEALGSQVKIVDCRAEAYYTGIDVNDMHGGRKGHLPGAKTIPYVSLFEKSEAGNYQFVSKETLADIFEKQGLKKTDEIILYCHIGLQLTSVYTSSQLLGYTNVKVYDGSMHEWGPDKSLPVVVE